MSSEKSAGRYQLRKAATRKIKQPNNTLPGRNGQGKTQPDYQRFLNDLQCRLLRSIRRGRMDLANRYAGRLFRLQRAGR